MDKFKGNGLYVHGNSFANGPVLPWWMRSQWEYAIHKELQPTFWDLV